MEKRNLIILSDYGLDDAVATAHILTRRELFGTIDIIAVGGNVSADTSLLNAKKLLSNLETDSVGVRLVDTGAVKQHFSCLPSIHGADGMGDLFDLKPLSVPIISYAEFVCDLPHAPVVLSLGPLTVTVDLLGKLVPSELVIMAGMVAEKPNFNGYEFNQYLDIPAFCAAVRYPHVIATLDTCRAPRFNMIDRAGSVGGVLGKLIDRAIELAAARHPDNSYIYDYVAAQYLTDPQTFTVERVTDPWGNALNQLQGK